MFVLFSIIKTLLYLLITILGLILLFIIIPLEYEFNTKIDEKIRADVNLSFFKKFLKMMVAYEDKETLFLIKVMGLCIIRKKVKMSNRKKENEKVKLKKKKKKNVDFNIKDYIQGAFINDLINYFKDIINITKPKRIKINGIYGFEDPSLTGIACGIVPLVPSLIPTSDINLQPVFDDEIIDIYCEIHGEISLLAATIRTLKFVLKKNNRGKIFKNLKKPETY
ncbi:DUF2953 domain-containing protein [Clostridium estertheticum]|uniref:DUF2953 domain-containing protein n=1 Tax=Clostridium estertheticum TaxID=238834 RepID=UPI0013EE8F4B|nr:DUF2953 domain-containing protein [Clostridium estertheticum]MBZ9607921.1 DUF2953 domain-containing protein [Clostridium estertheticum]